MEILGQWQIVGWEWLNNTLVHEYLASSLPNLMHPKRRVPTQQASDSFLPDSHFLAAVYASYWVLAIGKPSPGPSIPRNWRPPFPS